MTKTRKTIYILKLLAVNAMLAAVAATLAWLGIATIWNARLALVGLILGNHDHSVTLTVAGPPAVVLAIIIPTATAFLIGAVVCMRTSYRPRR